MLCVCRVSRLHHQIVDSSRAGVANATFADPGTLRSSFWAFTRQAIRRPLFLVSPEFASLDILTLQAPSASSLRRSARARSSARALDPPPPAASANGAGSSASGVQARSTGATQHARASSQPAPVSNASTSAGANSSGTHSNQNPPHQSTNPSASNCGGSDTPIRHTCGRETEQQSALPADSSTAAAHSSPNANLQPETSDCVACRLDSMAVTSVQMFDALLSYCGFRSAKRTRTRRDASECCWRKSSRRQLVFCLVSILYLINGYNRHSCSVLQRRQWRDSRC